MISIVVCWNRGRQISSNNSSQVAYWPFNMEYKCKQGSVCMQGFLFGLTNMSDGLFDGVNHMTQRENEENSVTIACHRRHKCHKRNRNGCGSVGCNVWWRWVLACMMVAGTGGRFNCLSRVRCYFQCGIQLESAGCGSAVGWVLSCVIGKADKSVLIAQPGQQSTRQVQFQRRLTTTDREEIEIVIRGRTIIMEYVCCGSQLIVDCG